ncbi:MAG TPA: Crp/Fnr family transcriptional regulator [Phaeodactylibacter sp.]|nr:Crp/Fnr family transcriptional regulator [Phaeodactylibacter sp.]
MEENIMNLLREGFPHIAEKALQEEIAEHGRVYDYREGQVIMEYGSYVKKVPLIVSGLVKVMREDENGRELFLYYLEKGQTCAASFTCCMMHKRSYIKTIAEEDTVLIGVPIRYVDEWMGRYQSWKNFVMKTYDDRLLELIRTIDKIAFMKMDSRLLDYLENKAEVTGSSVVEVTHQQIADDINASREAVSRLLKQLERSGRIRLGRNRVELLEV